ncbi:uncharacterized protein yc1106_09392 [Curvularia clavata]|uniref:Uncharacterized protein n=1 Tax=Curvularia clavata TaxID=95742 RepID=A0A9Q9DVF9_CURCL|nr:uncharacterized protein yc1106_09392 [Curvularia clavata]
MGIPYSRQINAAFEQVTPLVAAGFTVLRTTRDISILLAIIQVLTVVFLALIFFALILLVYCVNPDLEEERQRYITPWLRYAAGITLWGVLKFVVALAMVFGGASVAVWKALVAKKWVEDVEYEGNVRAEMALDEFSDLDEVEGNAQGNGDKKKNNSKGQGKKK